MIRLGTFELLRAIAEGGMGVVWKARHISTGEPVAVKILKGASAQDEEFQALLRAEVQSTARLDHPHIVSIYDQGVVGDVGEGTTVSPGDPYYAMEYVQGPHIRAAATDWEKLRKALLELLAGLAHAHARDVIHRDIKPDNVLCRALPAGGVRVVVTDFGIAHAMEVSKPTWDDSLVDTVHEDTAGTPAYMAPEQAMGLFRDYGPWTDLYAVGIMTYELVCGVKPFRGAAMQMVTSHVYDPMPALAPKMDVPAGLDAWVLKMCAKDVRDRFRSAAHAARALIELGNSLSLDEDTWVDESQSSYSFLGFESDGEDDELGRVPLQWNASRPHDLQSAWVPSGTGLLGLKTLPLVGRGAEQRQLWDAFRQVVETGSPRAVVLSGPAGAGKSRLGAWLQESVRELGVADTMRATHQPKKGELDGVSGMLALYHRSAGLSAEGIERRMVEIVGRRGGSELEAMAIAALIRGAGRSDSIRPSDMHLTPVQATRLLLQEVLWVADRGPLVVLLDDLQWGPRALNLMFEAVHLAAPVLFIATVQDESRNDGGLGASIDTLASLDGVQEIPVGFLSIDDSLKLVREGLGLDGSLARQVAERSGGSPLVAIQTVCHWLDTGELIRDGSRLSLTTDAPSVPTDLLEMWRERLDTALGRMERAGADPITARLCLEAAAVLGFEVEVDEWREVLRGLDLDRAPVVEVLDEARLVEVHGRRVRFVHRLVRDAIVDEASRSGRWKQTNLRVAYFLMRLYRADHPDLAQRVAAMFAEAQAWEMAVDALWSATKTAIDNVDYGQIGELGTQLMEAMDRVPVPSDDPRYVATQFWLGTRLVMGSARDEVDDGREMMQASIATARNAGDRDELAVMLAAYGWSHMHSPTPADGLPFVEEAVALANDADAQSQVFRGYAFLLGAVHRNEDAVQWAAKALEAAERTIDEIRARTTLGHALLHLDAFTDARVQLVQAARLCEANALPARAGAVYSSLGDLEFRAGNLDDARSAYEKSLAIKLALLTDSAYAHSVRDKLGRVALLAGDTDGALELFLEVRAAKRRGERVFHAHPEDGILAVAARRQDWEMYESVREEATNIPHANWTHERVLEVAAEALAAAGAATRAADLAQAAARLFPSS